MLSLLLRPLAWKVALVGCQWLVVSKGWGC